MPHIPSLGYSHCEVIRFRPFVFYPDKPIQVQVTVNHIDTSDVNYVHDAAVSWIEDVTYEQFTACVMAAGYNERKSRANVSIDWVAYQGAPVGGVTGEVRMSQWWTGTTCKTVNFPSVSVVTVTLSIILFVCLFLRGVGRGGESFVGMAHILEKSILYGVSALNTGRMYLLQFGTLIEVTKRLFIRH